MGAAGDFWKPAVCEGRVYADTVDAQLREKRASEYESAMGFGLWAAGKAFSELFLEPEARSPVLVAASLQTAATVLSHSITRP